jgi:hypothetical protein
MAVPEAGRWSALLDAIGVAGAAKDPSENECGGRTAEGEERRKRHTARQRASERACRELADDTTKKLQGGEDSGREDGCCRSCECFRASPDDIPDVQQASLGRPPHGEEQHTEQQRANAPHSSRLVL